ncbi:MAG: TetR family transcriptional regulator C-terminal domain-containing protein [Xanthobacteraceae bacterium]|jgi:TetR/AcrR family transcriptional repressor of nem operon
MPRPSAREEIVQAGLKCLIEKGFNAVGVQDITDAAGVPKGSFYNHFESKEALGVEVVERYGANQTRREILTDPAVPPLQRLRRHFDRINALFVDSHFARNCILGGFSAELANQSEAIRESLRKLYGRWTKDIEATIAEAQAKGEIATKTKASDLAAFLLDSYEGALLRARVERSRKPFDRFMKFAFGQLLI